MTALTELQKTEIIQAVKAYAADKGMVHERGGIHQTQLAKYLGISGSYMSFILRGFWNEIPAGQETVKLADSYFHKMAEKVGYALETELWKHFNTDNYVMTVTAIQEARESGMNHIIDGETGSGKSYAVDRYQRDRPNGTIVVTCDSFMTNTDFARALNDAVGGIPARTMYILVRNIEEQLKTFHDKGWKPVIIVDEAENLKDSSYGAIKAICDRMQGKCPVVLVGANSYIQQIRNKAARRKGCFPQIWSRFKGGQTELFKLNDGELDTVCQTLGMTGKGVVKHLRSRTDNWRDLNAYCQRLMKEHHDTRQPITLEMAQTLVP